VEVEVPLRVDLTLPQPASEERSLEKKKNLEQSDPSLPPLITLVKSIKGERLIM
jgi:hypothetical protein